MTAAKVQRRPSATRRPQGAQTIWLIAVALGLAYWLGALGRADIAFQSLSTLPKAAVVTGKCLATGALVAAAFLAANTSAKRLMARAIAIIWVADLTLALGHAQLSGYIFVAAHLLAIGAFLRMPKRTTGRALAAVPGLAAWCCGIAGAIAAYRMGAGWLMATFPLFSATAALIAGRTVLPLVFVGGGYAVFFISDVVVVLAISADRGAEWGWLSWLTYFGGLSMIVHGLISDRSAAVGTD